MHAGNGEPVGGQPDRKPGFIGSGPPSVVALSTSETGTYTGSVTPNAYGQGTFTVTVRGFDSEGNLQVVGVCREIVTPVPSV